MYIMYATNITDSSTFVIFFKIFSLIIKNKKQKKTVVYKSYIFPEFDISYWSHKNMRNFTAFYNL